MTSARSIPVFDLYGDSERFSVTGYLHVERIHLRSRQHSWKILVHRHGALSQAFLITTGGGELQIEGVRHVLRAPALIWLPAGTVHGFQFEPDSDGLVITISDDFLAALVSGDPARDLTGALAAPLVSQALSDDSRNRLALHFCGVEEEFRQAEPGARAAIRGHLLLILTTILRTAVRAPEQPASRARALCDAFRQLVERHFRAHLPVPDYARMLKVSPDRLHEACRTITGRPPTRLIHERLMREAQRTLIYTSMSVAEVAFDLGFEDPAYFSRFFAKRPISP
jgi:AraC family transcriptional activator of pobA